MNAIATWVFEKNRLIISGDLNFKTIVLLWKQSLPYLENISHIDIDLSQVTNSNSAGLALLLEWLKYGKREKKTITFNGIPSQLHSIAEVAGIAGLFSN